MAESAVYLEVKEVFQDLDQTVECLRHVISKLSRTDALIWCARANLVVSNPFNTDETAQLYLLRAFFPEAHELERALRWMTQNSSSRGTAFFRGQLLELAYWVLKFSDDLPDDGHSFENAGTRRLFGQAALVSSSVWSDRINRAVAESAGLKAPELRRQVMAGVRASLEENSRGGLPSVVLGRGELLWSKYMPERWPESDAAFANAMGLSREDYLVSFAALLTHHLDVRPATLTSDAASAGLFNAGVWDASAAMAGPFRQLLATLTTPVEALAHGARSDSRDQFLNRIRRSPLVSTPDGRHIVLDPTFLAAQAVLGPLFAIAAANPGVYDCFRHFGEAFEAYVADLVTTRYATPSSLTPRSCASAKLWRGKKLVGEVDAAILLGPGAVCMIEAKAVFIPDHAVHDLASLQDAIRVKYASGAKSPKGVGQLARNIRELSAGGLTDLNEVLAVARKVFPLLLVYDPLLDAPGHVAFLLEEFVDELSPDERLKGGYFRKGGLLVAAPVVLTIDDFEWLEASLANFSLGELLEAYADGDPERVSDVRTFVHRTRFRQQMKPAEAASSSAREVLNSLGVKAFGDRWRAPEAG